MTVNTGSITAGHTIVIRTHDGPKNHVIPLRLHTILVLGPDYYSTIYVPP